jgi:hypothetical protein
MGKESRDETPFEMQPESTSMGSARDDHRSGDRIARAGLGRCRCEPRDRERSDHDTVRSRGILGANQLL